MIGQARRFRYQGAQPFTPQSGGGGTTEPVFRSASSNAFSGSSGSVSVPSGAATGDIIVIAIFSEGGTGFTVSGFTAIGSAQTAGGFRSQMYYRIRVGGDSSTISFTATSSAEAQVLAVCYQTGTFNSGSPIDGTATTNSGTGTTATGTGLTTTVDKSKLLTFIASVDNQTVPSGMTDRASVAGDNFCHLYDQAITPAAATGNRTSTHSPSVTWHTHMAAIKAAA